MRNYTNENFERFLRQNADGLNMQPSAKVWKGISGHLNRRRWRFGFLVGAGLVITTAVGYYYTNSQNLETTISKPSGLDKDASVHAGSLNSIAIDQRKKQANSEISTNSSTHLVSQQSSMSAIAFNSIVNPLHNNVVAEPVNAETAFTPTIVDSYPESQPAEQKANTQTGIKYPANPQTIESVLNSYSRRARNGKFGLQLYFTPTVSYRKLNDNNIDNVVTHKPDFGFEMGLAAKYKVGRNVKIRGGIQFNVNRYDIKTYNSTTQMATIRLTNRFGFDSVKTVTNYNNFSGYKSNWLENFFFQVSAPIGLELKLKGDDKTQFGIASTIQPTYILGDRAYLISSDYKNYAEVPRLIRRWNVNTSFETFVAYSTGKLKWQVGPQVRYQLLSSYVTKYPVKENLFDYGLKIGVSLNNQ